MKCKTPEEKKTKWLTFVEELKDVLGVVVLSDTGLKMFIVIDAGL